MTVTERDRGWNKLIRAMKRGDVSARVGIVGGPAGQSHGSLNNASLGAVHEFGTRRVPERSFLRATVDEQRTQVETQLARVVREFYGTQDRARLTRGLGRVAAKVTADVKKKIVGSIPPPNAPATVARKGSSTPLVDTGQLVNTISWDVQE